MTRPAKATLAAALTAAALLGAARPAPAQGVIQAVPDPIYDTPGVSPWSGTIFTDPFSGYLFGAGDVIRAQGQFMLDNQRARLLKEQVFSAKLDNRRKQLDQWLWERDNLPTHEEERRRFMTQQLERARWDPPITEIWSGKALNDLLRDAQRIESRDHPAGTTPLNPNDLAKINVTSGKAGGNIGIVKAGKVRWPLLLRRKDFAAERAEIDRMVDHAIRQASRGDIDADLLEDLLQKAKDLHFRLTGMARAKGDAANWSPTQYVDAKGFLNQFDDALRVLQQPDAAEYLVGRYVAKGGTIADLVRYMKETGLQFAPATPGTEAIYSGLYQALRDYDVAAGTAIELKTR